VRAAKAMLFFTKGYDDSIENAVKKVRPFLRVGNAARVAGSQP
jgi:hypothetical protein